MKRTRDAETSLAESIRAAEPSVAIFDLDSTLWDGNCENFESARMITPEEVVEASSGRSLKLFPDVQKYLQPSMRLVCRLPLRLPLLHPPQRFAFLTPLA